MQWVRNGSHMGDECSGYGINHIWVMNAECITHGLPRMVVLQINAIEQITDLKDVEKFHQD